MEIDSNIIMQASEQILRHLTAQKDRIGIAYSNNSEILEIGFKCRFSYVKNKFKIKTEINFVESRCKDNAVTWYDPKQRQFFENEPDKNSSDDNE